jgi:hypothetical protein
MNGSLATRKVIGGTFQRVPPLLQRPTYRPYYDVEVCFRDRKVGSLHRWLVASFSPLAAKGV